MVSYLQVENITKSFGDLVLFENISFGINKDQKVALIAKNGTGKTTLLNIIAGIDAADSGEIVSRNDIKIEYLEQQPIVDENLTVIEQALKSSEKTLAIIEEYQAALKSNDEKTIAVAMQKMDAHGAWDFEVRMKQVLSKFKIDNFDQPVKQLSGGQRKRIALANVILNEPDLLIMDEPTNHLDLEMIEWLEEFLRKSACTLLMVTHDRYFLDRVCTEIIELDDMTSYKYRGNYSYFLEKREERVINRNAFVEKNRELLKKELDWMNRTPSARGTKAKHRIDKYYDLKDKVDTLNVIERKMDIDIKTTRLGKKIIDVYNIRKTYDDFILLDDFTHRFAKGEKIGIVGKNGCGKTTLLNLITGSEPFDSGKIDVGETVKVGYYKQDGIILPDTKRVIEVIKDIAEVVEIQAKKGGPKKMSASQFLEYFLFPPAMHYNYVSKLSGGERRRLYMMTVLMQSPNFLILDEPTNDLDIMTLNVLEDYLGSYGGCVLIVSHDRYFMDKVVDTLFVFEDGGKIKHFPGNYSVYRSDKETKDIQKKKDQKNATQVQESQKERKKEKKKFGFKQKHEYDNLEKEMAKLEEEKNNLETAINSATLSTDDLIEKSNQLKDLLELLDEKEMRWLELEEMKEEDAV